MTGDKQWYATADTDRRSFGGSTLRFVKHFFSSQLRHDAGNSLASSLKASWLFGAGGKSHRDWRD
jgi:hypothetical protein